MDSLISLRLEADSLIADVMSDLRYVLRKETAAHRRDIMRSYGARFSQKTEEAPVKAATDASGEMPVAEEGAAEAAAPAAMGLFEPYVATAVNGNGTAVRI
jgi:hypothetical protein